MVLRRLLVDPWTHGSQVLREGHLFQFLLMKCGGRDVVDPTAGNARNI